jgi:predicted lipoprotein with Yx(FWY)xxD motif
MKFVYAALCSLVASGAFAAPVAEGETAIGPVLVGENGMTLYTFAKDSAGASACYDDCASKWPPLFADEAEAGVSEGVFSVIQRKDGTFQWAANGMPLYFWMNDQAEGDTTGDGVGGVWSAARP